MSVVARTTWAVVSTTGECGLSGATWEPNISSSDVAVTVINGVVTLSASVPHFAEKLAIERAIQRVEGVKVIIEELEVNLAGFTNTPIRRSPQPWRLFSSGMSGCQVMSRQPSKKAG